MSIAPEEFLSYMNAAFDGMLNIAEELGDERINQRPNNMANTSTPFVILTHTPIIIGIIGKAIRPMRRCLPTWKSSLPSAPRKT